MFISEVSEANWFRISTTQKKVDYSNELFVEIVTQNIDKTPANLHKILKEQYVGKCPVIQYNHQRLYHRDEEGVMMKKVIDSEVDEYNSNFDKPGHDGFIFVS